MKLSVYSSGLSWHKRSTPRHLSTIALWATAEAAGHFCGTLRSQERHFSLWHVSDRSRQTEKEATGLSGEEGRKSDQRKAIKNDKQQF